MLQNHADAWCVHVCMLYESKPNMHTGTEFSFFKMKNQQKQPQNQLFSYVL